MYGNQTIALKKNLSPLVTPRGRRLPSSRRSAPRGRRAADVDAAAAAAPGDRGRRQRGRRGLPGGVSQGG